MGLKCVIVDDSFFIRTTLSSMIIDEGHTVVGNYEDGESFLGAMHTLDCDVIFLDIILPDTSGLDILRAIKSNEIDTNVIILTGVSQSNTISVALRLGATEFVTKPISKEDLGEILEKFAIEYKIPSVEELSNIGAACSLINKFISELNAHVFSSLRLVISNQCRSILEHKKQNNPGMFDVYLDKIEIHPHEDLWGNFTEDEVYGQLSTIISDIRSEMCFLYPEEFIDSLIDQAYLTMYSRPRVTQLINIVTPEQVGLTHPVTQINTSDGDVRAITTFEELEYSLSLSVYSSSVHGPVVHAQINDHLIEEMAVMKNNIFYSTIIREDDKFMEGLYGPLPVSSMNEHSLSALIYIIKLLENTTKEQISVLISIYFTPGAEKIASDYNKLSFIIKARLSNINYVEELDRGVLRNILQDSVNFILDQ